jgi:hypothetical protein
MRSIKGGFAASLVSPLVLIFLLASNWGLRLTQGSNFWSIVTAALIAWWFFALLSLPLCAFRLWLTQRGFPNDLPQSHQAWKFRQGASLKNGGKLLVILALSFVLILFVEAATRVKNPGNYDTAVTIPRGVRSLSLSLEHPDARNCASEGSVLIRSEGLHASFDVTSNGHRITPTGRSSEGVTYSLPLSWPRNANSCYYEFPEIRTRGSRAVVYLYAPVKGSASDSTPPPTRFIGDYWGWRCVAHRTVGGCAVMAVIDYDPDAVLASLALLVAGALVAVGLSLLFSVGVSLLRGWREDGTAIVSFGRTAALQRFPQLKKFLAPP